ncbi:MAG: hypothetical protein SPI59_03835 [Finegoldia sp.]|nr:hypothetical protein [Finegoldia sp.]
MIIVVFGIYKFQTKPISPYIEENSAEKTATNFSSLLNEGGESPKEIQSSVNGRPMTRYEIYNDKAFSLNRPEQVKIYKNLNDDGVYKIQFTAYSFESLSERFDKLEIPITSEMKEYFQNPEEFYKVLKNKNSHFIAFVNPVFTLLNNSEIFPKEFTNLFSNYPYITITITTNKELANKEEQKYKNYFEVLKELSGQQE